MNENDVPYILKENTNLVKISQLYIIYYQYIIEENSEDLSSKENEDENKFYYGRINQLKFKLCQCVSFRQSLIWKISF